MKFADLDLTKSYTYADYLKWTFEERVELIKGKIFKLSPAPSSAHQRISLRLHLAIGNFLAGNRCEVFTAPFDVRLPRKSVNEKDIITVVQPDLFINCDPSKIEERGCLGAPDIVIEILSSSNNKKELKYKHELYQEAGVKEYWIVDPRETSVQVYLLIDGKLLASGHMFAEDNDLVTTRILPGFKLNLADLFVNL